MEDEEKEDPFLEGPFPAGGGEAAPKVLRDRADRRKSASLSRSAEPGGCRDGSEDFTCGGAAPFCAGTRMVDEESGFADEGALSGPTRGRHAGGECVRA